MERKNTLLLTVIAIATLLVAVVGATFAFFASQVNTTQNGLNVYANTESAASAIFLATGEDLSINVTAENQQRGHVSNNAVYLSATDTKNLNVIYGSSSAGSTLSCTYDLVFKWTGTPAYTYSDEVTHPTTGWDAYGKEFTLTVGTATVTGWTDSGDNITTVTGMAERNIAYDGTCTDDEYTTKEACEAASETWTETENTPKVMTLVKGARIHSNSVYSGTGTCSEEIDGDEINETTCEAASGTWTPAGGGTVVTWPVTISFYNLNLDQTALSGKNFVGRVEVANVVC